MPMERRPTLRNVMPYRHDIGHVTPYVRNQWGGHVHMWRGRGFDPSSRYRPLLAVAPHADVCSRLHRRSRPLVPTRGHEARHAPPKGKEVRCPGSCATSRLAELSNPHRGNRGDERPGATVRRREAAKWPHGTSHVSWRTPRTPMQQRINHTILCTECVQLYRLA